MKYTRGNYQFELPEYYVTDEEIAYIQDKIDNETDPEKKDMLKFWKEIAQQHMK